MITAILFHFLLTSIAHNHFSQAASPPSPRLPISITNKSIDI